MNELGVAPAVKQYPGWNRVRNPFTAIFPGDPALTAVSSLIKNRFNVEVFVSNEHKLIDSIARRVGQKTDSA
jgi:hypothetical protein